MQAKLFMNKTIFITGASSGIGKITAEYFFAKGWNIAATMRSPEKVKFSIDAANSGFHPQWKNWKMDVTDSNEIKKVFDEAIQHFGKIDVVFNNAGYALVGAFEAMSEEQIKKQFETNVFGVMNVTRIALPYFRSIRGGTIINTSSMGGQITFPLYSIYHSTKWALEGFMESLQFECRRFNIRLKNIEPGAIQTGFENALDFVSNDVYDSYVQKAHRNMLDTYKSAPGPDVVAREVYKAANDLSFNLRYPVGNNAPLFLFLRRILPLSWFSGIVRMVTEKGIPN